MMAPATEPSPGLGHRLQEDRDLAIQLLLLDGSEPGGIAGDTDRLGFHRPDEAPIGVDEEGLGKADESQLAGQHPVGVEEHRVGEVESLGEPQGALRGVFDDYPYEDEALL